MGLREFRLREFLKRNFDFLAGLSEELGFSLFLLFLGLIMCYLVSGV